MSEHGITVNGLVDYAGHASDIAGTVIAIEDEYALVQEYFINDLGREAGHGARPALTRRMPLDNIRPHRHGHLCECD